MKRKNRMRPLAAGMVIVLALLVIGGGTALAESGFAGGNGTEGDPYEIANAEQLNNVRNYPNNHFILKNDINLSNYLSVDGNGYNDGAGWEPIGSSGTPFTGTFDGGEFTITGLFINRPMAGGIGLFGHTGNSAEISDLRLVAVNVTGSYFVGGLVGENNGEIDNCSVEGSITGNDEVGGLVGFNSDGTITESHAAGEVTGCVINDTPPEDIGGLVGNNVGNIQNSYSMATVNVVGYVNEDDREEYLYVGGLAGLNGGVISNSYATGDVTALYDTEDESTGYAIGGLVGFNSAFESGATITDSYATGKVTGEEYVGGLVGQNQGHITNSYATGAVEGFYDVGGLVGLNENEIVDSRSVSSVIGNSYVGGLVGSNCLGDVKSGEIIRSYAEGEVTGDNFYIGGLVGHNHDTIENSYATGKVIGEETVGGLVGQNEGTITNSYATGEVPGEDYVGGLVGDNEGSISNSYYEEETTGQDDGNGIPKTTDDMKLRSTYADWNFLNIWGIVDDEGYPVLRWQDGAPQSGFDVAAESPIYMGIEFQLEISQAKGADGNMLDGDVLVRVYSETQGEDVVQSGIDFSAGEAALPVTLDTYGTHNLRVFVDGVSYSNLLTMELLAVQSIAVTNPPDKTIYYAGEELDLEGLEVTGTYSDDFTAVLPITIGNISGFDSSEVADDQVVTVTYAELTATFTVNIIESQYKSIEVTNPPDKITYYVGEELDLTGLVVTGTLIDDSTVVLVITEVNISGFDSSEPAASQTITVTVEGINTTFEVMVLPITYTVNYDANGGMGTAPEESDKAQGDTFTAAPNSFTAPSGKQFKEWNTDASGTGIGYLAGETVTMPAGDLILYAIWKDSPSGGGGSGGGKKSAPTVYSAEITGGSAPGTDIIIEVNTRLGNALVNLDKQAKDLLGGEEIPVITVPSIQGVDTYTLELPGTCLCSSSGGDILTFCTEIGSITIPGNMLTGTGLESRGDIGITIGEGDKFGLPDNVRQAIGDRPIVKLTLTVEGEQENWSNPDASVTVSIPYEPTEEELADPGHTTVWYIDGSGNAVEVPNGRYDPVTGTVTFNTTHFSRYAVVYVKKTFDDLGSVEWARQQIEVLASKGIVRGTTESEYSPSVNITRADFLYSLVRTLGVDAAFDGNFIDIAGGVYYYKEIGIAKELGITSGTGDNKFCPDESITRQDMITLTVRAMIMLDMIKEQASATGLDKFTDKSLIADYALEAIAAAVKEGLIIGSGDCINPLGNTTRAEAAVFLYRIYNKF
jgi:hypothetical protein